jgi:hypothetical protein
MPRSNDPIYKLQDEIEVEKFPVISGTAIGQAIALGGVSH